MASAYRTEPRAAEVFPLLEDPNADPMVLYRMSAEEALAADTPFTDLIQVWANRRTDENPPHWDDFDFAHFRGWHSRLCVTAFRDETPDPEIRISGDEWIATGGASANGLRIGQIVPRLYELQLRDHFQAIRDTGCIGLTVGRVAFVNRGFIRMKIVELPVSRYGERVGGLIHGLHIDNRGD